MNKDKNISIPDSMSPFERIRRTNAAGFEHWSSRDFASILGYTDYRNFESVIGKARLSCFNSGHRIEDHFVDITEMVTIGSGRDASPIPMTSDIVWGRIIRRRINEAGQIDVTCQGAMHRTGCKRIRSKAGHNKRLPGTCKTGYNLMPIQLSLWTIMAWTSIYD